MFDESGWNKEFKERFNHRYDELKWLYFSLYGEDYQALDWLTAAMWDYYSERKSSLKKLDRQREKNPDWYKGNGLLGMMMYSNLFGGNLQGVRSRLDYIKDCGVNYLHLMPLLDSPKGKDDGGYAVADFRKVKPELGTMKDLEELTEDCHNAGISVALDFVMNHTSEEHIWAKLARQGDMAARSRYFFYDNWDIPSQFERTMPEVFPTTAPGNFTWLDDCKRSIYMEAARHKLPQPAAGSHNRPDDADHHGGCLPGRPAAGRGRHGAVQGRAVLRDGREAGVSHPL